MKPTLPLAVVLALSACEAAEVEQQSAELAALQEEVATLRAEVEASEGRLAAVETSVGAFDGLDVGSRLDVVEAEVGLLQNAGYATETWVDSQGFATEADLGALAGRVTAHDGTLTAYGTSLSDLLATDLDHEARLTAQKKAADDLGTTVGAHTSTLSSHASTLSSHTSTLSSHATSISSHGSSISRIDGSVTTLTGSVSKNTTDIVANRTRIVDLETDFSDLSGDLAGVQTDLSDLEDTVESLEVSAKRHYATFTGNVAYEGSGWSTLSKASLTFTKIESSSPIYVMYHDTLRVTGTTSSWCRWEVLIDGDPCTSPGAIYTDLHEDGSNIHRTSPVAGFCTATAKGSIGAGSHTITVRHQRPGGRGQCYTGWDNVRGHLFVDELAF